MPSVEEREGKLYLTINPDDPEPLLLEARHDRIHAECNGAVVRRRTLARRDGSDNILYGVFVNDGRVEFYWSGTPKAVLSIRNARVHLAHGDHDVDYDDLHTALASMKSQILRWQKDTWRKACLVLNKNPSAEADHPTGHSPPAIDPVESAAQRH